MFLTKIVEIITSSLDIFGKELYKSLNICFWRGNIWYSQQK